MASAPTQVGNRARLGSVCPSRVGLSQWLAESVTPRASSSMKPKASMSDFFQGSRPMKPGTT